MSATESLLLGAKTLLANEAHWCKKAAARKSNGFPCSPLSEHAIQFDICGALLRAARDGGFKAHALLEAEKHVRLKIPSSYRSKDLEHFNDSLPFSAISALFD